MLKVLDSLPSSHAVEEEFSRLTESMTRTFESVKKSEDGSLREYVENFLRIHTANHNGNKDALNNIRNVSVRCPPPNGAVSGSLVSTIDSGHLGALYGCEAEETALAG